MNKIDELYEEIKSTKIYSELKFVEVSAKLVEKVISKLDVSSGVGISDKTNKPLFKHKGEKTDPNNYRGISIIAPLAKVFEKILAAQIHLKLNNVLFDAQHGFREDHSCESALHELISDLNSSKDKKLTSLLLFIDFKKAFDLVDSMPHWIKFSSTQIIRKIFRKQKTPTTLHQSH